MSNIIRIAKNKTHPYSIVSNAMISDENLSWEACGLLTYLLSKPDNWQVRVAYLVSVRPGGRERMQRMLKELETAGYLKREKRHAEDGTWIWQSTIYEQPNTDGQTIDGFSVHGKSVNGKPVHLLSTESVSTEITNTEIIGEESSFPPPLTDSGFLKGEKEEIPRIFDPSSLADPLIEEAITIRNEEEGGWIGEQEEAQMRKWACQYSSEVLLEMAKRTREANPANFGGYLRVALGSTRKLPIQGVPQRAHR